MGGACGTHREMRNAYKIFVGKPKGNRPLGRPKRRRENNIKMNLKGRVWEFVDLIHQIQDRKQ
jgi:hypothetical protein